MFEPIPGLGIPLYFLLVVAALLGAAIFLMRGMPLP